MPSYDAAGRLYEAAVQWATSQDSATRVVNAACDALVDGLDTPSLRMLAGVSLRQLRGADREITDLLAATLAELGIAFPTPGSEAAHEALARITARRALRGEVTPRELAAWAHQVFGHHLPLTEPLAALDDVYDTIEYTSLTRETVDADVLSAAQAIADSGEDPPALP
jgi:hypothetical protein